MNPQLWSGEAGRTFVAALLLGVMVCLSAAFWCFRSILLEHYVELYRRNKSQRKCQPEQTPCEPDNLVRLPRHFFCRPEMILRDTHFKCSPRTLVEVVSRAYRNVVYVFLNITSRSGVKKLIDLRHSARPILVYLRRLFSGHIRKTRKMTPNSPDQQRLSGRKRKEQNEP